MRRITNYGGIAAGLILIAFGAAALVMGVAGHGTVTDSLKQERIVGTTDMAPSAIKAELAKAGLKNVDVPSKSVANAKIDTAGKARTFARVGIALLLVGVGFGVVTSRVLFARKERGEPAAPQTAAVTA
jgi:hypothetical protein